MKWLKKILGRKLIIILTLLMAAVALTVLLFPARVSLFVEFVRDDIRKPLRRSVCLTAAKIDYSGRQVKCISRSDIKEITRVLYPGDIIFRRSEDQLTNIAIPGFWTHSAIYVGDREEINSFFSDLKVTLGLSPWEYIVRRNPLVARKMAFRRHMVIEAVGEGVSINTLAHFANADYFSAVRPVADKERLFRFLLAAFDNYGKPYDFFFDFQNDDAFFCSELVYKSLASAGLGEQTIKPSPDSMEFITPNDIALQLTDEESSSVFRFVTFYCADENMKKTRKMNKADLRFYAFR